jgi:hypothetical protein
MMVAKLTDELRSRYLRILNVTSSSNWTGNLRMLAGCEEILKEKKRSSSARLQCLISSSRLQEPMHRHFYCRTLEVMVQMTSLHYKRKFHLYKISFVCRISYFLQTFCMCLLFLDQISLCGTTYFSLTLRLWENPSPLTSSRLTSPVLESTTRELWGEYCALITLAAEREHHEHCYIARKKSALTEGVVRFNICFKIQAYSTWNPKKL